MLDQVRLLGGPVLQARERDRRYLMSAEAAPNRLASGT
jgi:hypothetical protein